MVNHKAWVAHGNVWLDGRKEVSEFTEGEKVKK